MHIITYKGKHHILKTIVGVHPRKKHKIECLSHERQETCSIDLHVSENNLDIGYEKKNVNVIYNCK